MTHLPAAFGLYPSTRALHLGAEALRSARFRQTDISVLYSDGTQALELRKSVELTGVADDEDVNSLGGVLSELSGIGAVEMHDDGPFVCAGPVLMTLVSHGSGLSSTLRTLGVPDGFIPRVQQHLRRGSLLLTVQCDDEAWACRAQEILENTGAADVSATL
jgi:hypothetical protein